MNKELAAELETYKTLVAESIKDIRYCIERKSLNKLGKYDTFMLCF